jgi:hypothetical protein
MLMFVIKDENSTNGVLVNGEDIEFSFEFIVEPY